MTDALRRFFGLPAATLLCLVAGTAPDAREIHYGAVDHAELGRCDAAYWRGQHDEATRCYQGILGGDVPTAIRAEAAWALRDLQMANRLFQAAVREHPEDADIRTRWGDLYADSHQAGEAMNIYREALGIDPAHPRARLGSARVLSGSFDDAANTYLQPLLADADGPDGVRAAAWLLVARVSLESGDEARADDALQTAAEIIAANDWPPLEVYALRAAADLLNNVTDSEWTNRSLSYNPHYGDIYALPAHFYVITRRYREAIDLYQKAIDIDPRLAAAHEELGVNLLRDNQMSRARKHLEIAHNEDPFSPKAVNTLRLLDSFENFRLIDDPPLPEPGTLPIVLRLHEDEADVLAPYAIRLARDSIERFTERYDFHLKEPVVIEMYPDHEDFAVRTAGMPGLGILGATFGYVIAMDSPSGRPPEQFQWGTTLWHEMAHVFTLEATNHLVPRWYSEGISVFEEWVSGPNPGVRIPMSVFNAMKDDRFLPIVELDEGFIRPTYEEQVIVSYMQAGLTCHFIYERFGEDKLRDLLYKYRDGADTRDAIESVLDMSVASFDRAFDDFVDEQHGDFLAVLQDWHQLSQQMMLNVGEENWAVAATLAEQMIGMSPGYVEPDSPYLVLARAEEERGDEQDALRTLETFWKKGGYAPRALKKLAEGFEAAGRIDDAIDTYGVINLVEPLDQSVHGALGDLLLERGDAARALEEYRVALALNPHDRATAHYRVANASHRLGRSDEARSALLQALDVAPNFRPAQRLLLELMRGDTANNNR